MRQTKIVLTSIAALVIASPSMAAVGDVITTGASCTIGDLGVSSGTANATAQFSVNSYNCDVGTYLPAGDTWTAAEIAANDGCRTCPSGSYCYGDIFTYSDDEDQGIASCDDDYEGSTSDAGATSLNECYWSGVSCPTISAATACDTHAATCAYTTPANATNKIYYPETDIFTGSCDLTFTCATGYTKSTSQTAPTLPSTATNGNSLQYRSHNGQNDSNSDNDLSAGEWKVSWTSGATQGTMNGIASCNSVPGNNDEGTWPNPSTLPANTNLINNSADASDATRLYCWCKPTSWTPSGGSEQNLSAAWVFLGGNAGGASGCASGCAAGCANGVVNIAYFRSALFGVVGASMQCVANNITLSWNNENGTQFTSGSCTYDESLTVPSTHPDKRGYTFTGWKFVSPSQN